MHKDKIKTEMRGHQHPRDRFKVFIKGLISQATELADSGKSTHEILTAATGLESQLDEAWDDIEGHGAGSQGKS